MSRIHDCAIYRVSQGAAELAVTLTAEMRRSGTKLGVCFLQASWMHSSRGLLADNATVAQAGWLHSKAVDELARSSGKAAAREEQPPALGGRRPELAHLSHKADHEEQPPGPGMSTAPPAWVRSKGRGEFANFAAVAAPGKSQCLQPH